MKYRISIACRHKTMSITNTYIFYIVYMRHIHTWYKHDNNNNICRIIIIKHTKAKCDQGISIQFLRIFTESHAINATGQWQYECDMRRGSGAEQWAMSAKLMVFFRLSVSELIWYCDSVLAHNDAYNIYIYITACLTRQNDPPELRSGSWWKFIK